MDAYKRIIHQVKIICQVRYGILSAVNNSTEMELNVELVVKLITDRYRLLERINIYKSLETILQDKGKGKTVQLTERILNEIEEDDSEWETLMNIEATSQNLASQKLFNNADFQLLINNVNTLFYYIISDIDRFKKDYLPESEFNLKDLASRVYGISMETHPEQDENDHQIEELRKKVNEYLLPFTRSWHGERIMNPNDFPRLREYVYYLVEFQKLPKKISPIPATKLPTEFIRKTFSKLHEELYGKRKRKYWIDFLHEVFVQFRSWEKETTDKNFKTYRSNYDTDLKSIMK